MFGKEGHGILLTEIEGTLAHSEYDEPILEKDSALDIPLRQIFWFTSEFRSATVTATRYAYDAAFRLISITDPNGQVFLRNTYDDYGRISQQKHGSGTFKFQYETIGESDLGFPVYRTQVQLKNGALLDLKHDAFGHVVEKTLVVSAESLATEDRGGSGAKLVPLITKSEFNRHGEIVRQTYRAGDTICRTHDEESADARNQGNLLEVKRTPAPGADTDQTELITKHSYVRDHQHVEVTIDPRGMTTRFEYDDRGNLIKKAYPAVTVPEIASIPNGKRMTRQAKLSESFEYNKAGPGGNCPAPTKPRSATKKQCSFVVSSFSPFVK